MVITPVDTPGEANVGASFNKADYFRRLNFSSVEIQRIRLNKTPQGVLLMSESVRSLAALVKDGMAQAKTIASQAERDEFIDRMRKIVASSGMPMLAGVTNSDLAPAKTPGLRIKTGLDEMIFRDRLPRFMKKWADGDPEWRLLECAIRLLNDQTFLIGMAETSQRDYSIFHGTTGGDYKTKTMPLLDAQNVLTAAYKRGYSPVSVKAFGLIVGNIGVDKQNYSVVKMTNGARGKE